MSVRATVLSLLAVVPAVAGCQKAPAAKPANDYPVAVLAVTPTETSAIHSYTGVVPAVLPTTPPGVVQPGVVAPDDVLSGSALAPSGSPPAGPPVAHPFVTGTRAVRCLCRRRIRTQGRQRLNPHGGAPAHASRARRRRLDVRMQVGARCANPSAGVEAVRLRPRKLARSRRPAAG